MNVGYTVAVNPMHPLGRDHQCSLGGRDLVLNARKLFSFLAWQQHWFYESWVKMLYRRKGNNVNSTLIRPKRIQTENQPETEIHRK